MTFDTSVLDRAIAERDAELECRRLNTLTEVVAAMDEYLPRYGVTEAYVFGSLARPGSYHEMSDIDISVVWDGCHDFFGMAADVSRALGQDIDILPLHQLPFASKIKLEGIKWTPTDDDH